MAFDDELPDFPPRGRGQDKKASAPHAGWTSPMSLSLDKSWDWASGKIALGQSADKIIGEPDRHGEPGRGDDRHIVTIAGSRAGKSSTVLVPNLMVYPGSVIVIDPKGELARDTFIARSKLPNHKVVILDPFNVSGFASANYNPMDELDPSSPVFVDDVGLIADALIIDFEKDRHWTDAAKALVRGLILYMAASGPCSLARLWKILCSGEGRLTRPTSTSDDPNDYLFCRMTGMEEFSGRLALIGLSFLEKQEDEMASILSTARVQLAFLDSDSLTAVSGSSAFRLSMLKTTPITLYLCLPATRLSTHSRWLRLIISLALNAMERNGAAVPRHPVLFLLEEFAALGHMRPLEYAAGFMAAFGVKLWSVLQDISQLKTHYEKSWETFLGNAGIIQAFGNSDFATTEHLSKLLGNTRVVETRETFASSSARSGGDLGRREDIKMVRLLEPSEIAMYFARETNRQLILVPGRTPTYLDRLPRP